ncbi:hypothetical protein MTO96_036848 [Rhipicephalus appendiculatus]
MKVHESEAGSSSNGQSTPKKRAVACEQDGVANQVKFQLRHTFSAISERIKQLGEIFAQLQITLQTQNDRGSSVESFLENVVAPALTPNAVIEPHAGAMDYIFHTIFSQSEGSSSPQQNADDQAKKTLTVNVRRTGYQLVSRPSDGRDVCTLVSNKLTHLSHDLQMATSNAEYVINDILPASSERRSIFLPNVYCSPVERRQRFKPLLKKIANMAGSNPLLVMMTWGYPFNRSKGEEL